MRSTPLAGPHCRTASTIGRAHAEDRRADGAVAGRPLRGTGPRPGWHLVDEELHAHVNEQLATNSALLGGRVTYEPMEAFWPHADQDPDHPPTMRESAGIWRAVPKIVFSRTPQAVGPGASLRVDVDPDEIRALQQQPGGDMTLGGADLAGTLPRLDLVDEYRLCVAPVVVGGRRRSSETGDAPVGLDLVEERRFGNGVVLLRYAVRRAAAPTGRARMTRGSLRC